MDLPIAISILLASNQISSTSIIYRIDDKNNIIQLEQMEVIGELTLTGEIRSLPFILPCIIRSESLNHTVIIPSQNAQQASLTMPKKDKTANHLLEVCNFIEQKQNLEPVKFYNVLECKTSLINQNWSDAKGQEMA